MSRYVGKHQGKNASRNTYSEDSRDTVGEDSRDFKEPGQAAPAADEKAFPEKSGSVALAERPPEQFVPEASNEDAGDGASMPRAKRFGRFLLIYSAVFLVLIAVGLAVFWQYIAAYEHARPEHAMDELLLSLQDGTAAQHIKPLLEVSAFEDSAAVFDEIAASDFMGQAASFRKMPGQYSDTSPVYILRLGSTDLFKVTLSPKSGNGAGFGFELWQISQLTLADAATKTVTIEAPPEAEVSVNGTALTPDEITDDHVVYDTAAPENRFCGNAYRVLYTVKGLFDAPEVVVLGADGTALDMEKAENGAFIFDLPRSSLKITAPAEASVTVNGVLLTKSDVTGSAYPASLFAGLEKYATDAPELVSYQLEGFLGVPEVTATDASGAALSPSTESKDAYVFGLDESAALKEKYATLATDFIKKYVAFSINENDDATGNFARLSKSLLPGTETYTRIKNTIEGISWVTKGTAQYNTLDAEGFVSCGDNCFLCTVALDLTVTADGNTRGSTGAYTLVFVKSGAAWLVGGMITD